MKGNRENILAPEKIYSTDFLRNFPRRTFLRELHPPSSLSSTFWIFLPTYDYKHTWNTAVLYKGIKESPYLYVWYIIVLISGNQYFSGLFYHNYVLVSHEIFIKQTSAITSIGGEFQTETKE